MAENNKIDADISNSKIKFPDPVRSYNNPIQKYQFPDKETLDQNLPRRLI